MATTRLGLYGGPRSPYPGFTAASASISLSGTSLTETQVVDGSQTTVLTLVNDTFVATLGADNAITTAFIAGIDSDGIEGTGWDATVSLDYTNVARDSDTQVTITWPATPSYAIDSDESVTITVPATSLAGAAEVVATPTVDVAADIEEESDATGGWWRLYESNLAERAKEKKRREDKKKEAQRIQDELEQQLALEQRKIEQEEARHEELAKLTALVEAQLPIIKAATNEHIAKVAQDAINRRTYSAMERMEREIREFREEEEFLMLAAGIILRQ